MHTWHSATTHQGALTTSVRRSNSVSHMSSAIPVGPTGSDDIELDSKG